MTISILIAVYKGESYLAEQIQSILDNDLHPKEIIFIDDCPETPSRHVVDGFSDLLSEIDVTYILQETNVGPTLSFKRAVLESKGDVLFFCDQDDFWNKEKISTLSSYFEEQVCLMVYSDGEITNSDLAPTSDTIFSTRKRADLRLGQQRNSREFLSNPDIKGCMMAFRGDFAREVFNSTPNNFHHYWGHDHWLALFAYAKHGIRVHNEPLFLHRFHGGNASSAVRFSIFNLDIFKRYWKRAVSEKPDHIYQRYALLKRDEFLRDLNGLNEAIDYFLEMETRRLGILKRSRIFRLWALLGLFPYFSSYRNGIASVFRDWLITPGFSENH